jgi:hypothetical protein
MQNPSAPLEFHPTPRVVLAIILSNGNPNRDARLTFEFVPCPNAHCWVLKLPQLANPEARPRQIADDTWEIRVAAVDDTEPIDVSHHVEQSASDLMDRYRKPEGGAPSEMVIVAQGQKISVSVTEFYPGTE